jgi:S-methylmethionine-dependent homocysteine/selenocysteine methylase
LEKKAGFAMPVDGLSSLLERARPVLIDGAVGTELIRLGVRSTLPLWSAHALLTGEGVRVLEEIHASYARAGADILVTNTFRTTRRALDRAQRGADWRAVNRRAVEAARAAASAAGGGACLVAGSIAPLEDCYSPELVPRREDCLFEHRRQIELLAELGVDLMLIETMNHTREAEAALTAALEVGIDLLLSLCPKAPAHLLSGEPLADVVPRAIEAGGDRLRGILLNCAPPETLEVVYPRFAGLVSGRPHGLYAHLGEPNDTDGWTLPVRHEPERHADWVVQRVRQGARLVGGCCGTTPEHIAALYRRLMA